MQSNRSVPTSSMLAHITYEDLETARAWLETALGFEENFRYGDPVAGIQMRLGDAVIMLNLVTDNRGTPAQLGKISQYLTVVVADVDAHLGRAVAANATIIEEINETMYGERQFVVRDPEGHHWLIAQHVRDVAPEDWGATSAHAT